MEQALSMTYATLRFVHMGWRVIKLEATPQSAEALPGDPNRYIGSVVADEGRRSYFVAPNVGKESIALNLKTEEGRQILRQLITDLNVDVFCCNTLPARYQELGIDYETLKSVKPDLIWAGISAMGPDHPDTAGYDPAIQAMAGFMEVTGPRDGPPTLSGIPLVDLKAGDEVFAHVWMGIAKRAMTGEGSRFDVSMMQAAASWLITTLPLVDFDCDYSEITRVGNEHRKFVPTNAYPTKDGAVLLAIGSDTLWRRLSEIPIFRSIAKADRTTNAGRLKDRAAIHADIAAVTRDHDSAAIMATLKTARIPHAPIHTIPQVIDLPTVAPKLTRTRTPDGRTVRMQPKAMDYPGTEASFGFPPQYGEHTDAILASLGYPADDIDRLRAGGIVAGPEVLKNR